MATLLAFGLLYVVGLPAGFAITGRITTALLIAPLVTGLIAAVAGIAVAAVGGSLSLWVAIVAVASMVASWVATGRPRSWLALRSSPSRPRMAGLDGWDAVVLIGPLVILALAALNPPVEWDARSIWWFHASWFWGGGSSVQPALGNAALAFSHPDYPPLVPATIAIAWRASGSSSLQLALELSTMLTMTALATLGFVVRNLVAAASAWWGRVAGLAVALSAWMLASNTVARGLVDHLWSACLAASAVLLLQQRKSETDDEGADDRDGDGDDEADGRRRAPSAGFALAIVLAGAAALTKNEGLVCAGALAVAFTIQQRRDLRRAAWAWAPVGLGLTWTVTAHRRGAASDLANSPTVSRLFGGDFTALDRARPTLDAMWGIVGWFIVGSAVVSLVATVLLRRTRRDVGLASAGWLWGVAGMYTAALVVTYVVSPWDIAWHLATSIDRTMVVVVLLVSAINASWFLVAAARPQPSTAPEDQTPVRISSG